MAEHDVTKTRFSLKKFPVDLSEISVGDAKLMPDNVLEVYRRYLLLFLSYRENTGEGGGNISPPSDARIKNNGTPLDIMGPLGARWDPRSR